MAEEKYVIPAQPQYSEDIRKLQDSDPASASQIFNPLISRLIENIASVKAQADRPVFAAGAEAPEDTGVLWIDTASGTGGLKYFNGSAWVPVPVSYT